MRGLGAGGGATTLPTELLVSFVIFTVRALIFVGPYEELSRRSKLLASARFWESCILLGNWSHRRELALRPLPWNLQSLPVPLFCSWIIIGSTVVTIIIVFDPLGGKVARYSSAGPGLLGNPESSQFFSGLKTAATSVWETRIKFLCCCIGQDDHTRVAFSSTAELFSTYFSVSGRGLLASPSFA